MTELLTLAEVAERLSISRRQVERYVAAGRLRTVRLGYRTVRVKVREFDAFIRQSEGRPGGP